MTKQEFLICERAFRASFATASGHEAPADTGDWFAYLEVETVTDAVDAALAVCELGSFDRLDTWVLARRAIAQRKA